MTTLDPFAHDDGAYVLGALSADEREAFERHLATCQACTGRVRELAPLAAMLAGLPASAYSDVPDPPPANLLANLLGQVRAERRRRHWFTAGLAGLAAACILALVVIAWPSGHSPAPRTGARPQAMTPVNAETSLHATAALTAVDWGTQIRLECRYAGADTPSVDYDLVVFDKSNAPHLAGSWKLVPGKVVPFTGGTALPRDQISRIEISVGDHPILRLRL